MINLKQKYQQAMAKKEQAEFTEQVKKSAALNFAESCRKIGFDNPNMVFSDNKNSIYQLRIVKMQHGYEVVQDRVDRKTLKSLLGAKSDDLVSIILEYADKYKQLKNPTALLNYGFYFRRQGLIEMHDIANFDNQIATYNNHTGEIKVFASLPEVIKHNRLSLLISCLTPDFSVVIDWLALYTMEIRKGLKKPFLNMHGTYYFPLICLIESIYPQGFYLSDYKTLPAMMKFKKWETRCFVFTSKNANYQRLAKLVNMFAQPIHGNIRSNTSLVMVHFYAKVINIQFAESHCFNIRLYDKETQLRKLEAIGMSDFQNCINEQIGDYCRKTLNKRYKLLMQEEDNMLSKFGLVSNPDSEYLTDKQCSDLLAYMIKELKCTQVEYFQKEIQPFVMYGNLSVMWIFNICIDYRIKFEYFVKQAVGLGLLNNTLSEIEVDGEFRKCYKVRDLV